jgi:Winged helix domain
LVKQEMKTTIKSTLVSSDNDFEVQTPNGPRQFTVSAPSYAKVLRELIKAGEQGITQKDVMWWTTCLAPKICDLRHRHGLNIATIYETHNGGGLHARYVLQDDVRAVAPSNGGNAITALAA